MILKNPFERGKGQIHHLLPVGKNGVMSKNAFESFIYLIVSGVETKLIYPAAAPTVGWTFHAFARGQQLDRPQHRYTA